MIHRKSARDLDRMAAAGAIVAETLGLLAETARPGMSTLDLDQIAERHIRAEEQLYRNIVTRTGLQAR